MAANKLQNSKIEGAVLTNTTQMIDNDFNGTVTVISYVIYNQVNSTTILFYLFETAEYFQYNSGSPSSLSKMKNGRKLLYEYGGITTTLSTTSLC